MDLQKFENSFNDNRHTVANSICARLNNANIDIIFWPFCFDHTLRFLNVNSCADKDSSCLDAVFSRYDIFKNLRYFGSCGWCCSPGDHDVKFKSNSRKGLFWGFLPDTTRIILNYNQQSNWIKKASHSRFDEGFNDLSLQQQPHNFINLCYFNNGVELQIDPPEYCTTVDFDFFTTPFAETDTHNITITCDNSTFVLVIDNNKTSHHAFISQIST